MRRTLAALCFLASAAIDAAPGVPVAVAGDALVALSVPDLARAQRWYATLFGLEEATRWRAEDGTVELVVLRRPGLTVELQHHATARARTGDAFLTHGSFKSAITVSDVGSALQAAMAAGATLRVPLFDDPVTGRRSAVISDPEGNLLQFFETPR